ncbi:MAG: GTP pyrophosphokinase family protein [Firmicutes bacterium]|nr:GTP pyrophosphokinase family protein [Bacillota bacterium]
MTEAAKQNIQNAELTKADMDMVASLKAKSAEYAKIMAYYKCAIMEIETKFNVLDQEFTLQYDRNPINSVKSRLKSPESIAKKLQRKGLPVNLESVEGELNDIAGVRVVCSFRDDVYMLAEALLSQDDITLIEKKDYIENPKPNGYRSLHLIVTVPIFLSQEKKQMKVEIQLRTIAMDFWATLEHQLRYKKDVVFTLEMSERLYQCAEVSAAMDAGMDSLLQYVREVSSEHKDENIQSA